jgi:penicillin amidase
MKNVEYQGASNNWVISGNFTKSGKPIMSNDPHLMNALPSCWHLSSMLWNDSEGKEHYIIGSSYPGAGAFLAARNENLTWSNTNLPEDTMDFFEERIEGDSYLYNGTWLPVTKRIEVIKVQG